MINLNFVNHIKYLLFLLPVSLPLGIAITEIIFLALICFFFIKNRDLKFLQNKVFYFLITISLYFAISAIIQIHDNLKISSIFYFRYALFSLSIMFILFSIEKKINFNILFLLLFISSLIVFDAFLQFFFGKNFFNYEIISNRISGIFKDELILGSFLLKILPIIIWVLLILNENIIKNRKYLILFFSAFFICIYLSAERTSFALLLIFLTLTYFFIHRLRKVIFFSSFILISFIFFTSFVKIGKSDPSNRIFIKTFNQITNYYFYNKKKSETIKENKKSQIEIRVNEKKKFQIFSSDHQGHYILAIELFKKNPLFGVGPKGFRYYCRTVNYDPPKGTCSVHPHNFLIQILSETGIIGLLIYLFSIFFLIFKIFKIYKNEQLDNLNQEQFLIISIALLINFFPLFPNGNFFNNWISIINYYYIGFYLYNYKKLFN